MKLLIDTDCGVDDAVAIAMAATCARADIVAVTCVAGNCGVRDAAANASLVLERVGKTAVPVFVGCAEPLLRPAKPLPLWDGHGPAGLGMARTEPSTSAATAAATAEHAALAIVRMARAHAGALHIATLGPLTNLALAVSLDPELPSLIAGVTIMGGTSRAQGNAGLASEFNFHADPEAARIVLERFAKVVVVPWELFECALPWAHFYQIFDQTRSPLAEWFGTKVLATLVPHARAAKRTYSGPFLPDAIAMLVCLQPSAVLESADLWGIVETAGEHTRGALIFDWPGTHGHAPNVHLVKKVDLAPYVAALMGTFSAAASWK